MVYHTKSISKKIFWFVSYWCFYHLTHKLCTHIGISIYECFQCKTKALACLICNAGMWNTVELKMTDLRWSLRQSFSDARIPWHFSENFIFLIINISSKKLIKIKWMIWVNNFNKVDSKWIHQEYWDGSDVLAQ